MIRKVIHLLNNQYVYSIISKTCILLLGFLYMIIQARYLGAEIKGQITYVTSITSITAIVFGFGIHQAYPYYKKLCSYDILPSFIIIAIIQFILYFIVSIILGVLIDDIKIKVIVWITPVIIYNKIVSYITLIENPNKKNTLELMINIVELFFVIVLSLLTPASFLIGVFIVAFKDTAMSCICTWQWRFRIFNGGYNLKDWPLKLVKFGFFPMLALLMTTLNYRVDVIMLEGKVPDASIGVYSIGVMLAERVWLIPDSMKEVMVSKIAGGKGVDEVSFVIRACNTACLFLVLGIVVVGKPLIEIFFGSQYDGAYRVTLILLIGVFFMIYYKMIASYNIVIGKQTINFIFLLISVICNVVSNAILIPLYGIFGAGIASVVSYGLCSLLFVVYFRKLTNISYSKMLFIRKTDLKIIRKKIDGGKN